MNAPLPHSRLHEERALGYALVHPEWLPWLTLHLGDRDFYLERTRILFGQLRTMEPRAEAVSIPDLVERLQADGELEKIGGVKWIGELVDAAATTAAEAEQSTARVRALRRIRQVIAAARTIDIEGHRRAADDLDDFTGWAEGLLYQALREGGEAPSVRTLAEGLTETLQELEQAAKHAGELTGVPTDFEPLDRITGGWQRGEYYVLAGRPGMGKTAFAGATLWRAARAGSSSLFFSLEMSRGQIVRRMLAAKAGVNTRDMRTAQLTVAEWERLHQAARRLTEGGTIHLCDDPRLTVERLASLCRLHQARGGLGLVVIDYLQLLRATGRYQTREREIAAISSALKALAKELDVPVIALSQLNRSLEQRQNKRPQISDLRDSGAIEQDADGIVFLYRDEVYDPDTRDRGIAEVHVAKQRNGPTGLAKLHWVAEFTRFEEISHDRNAPEQREIF